MRLEDVRVLLCVAACVHDLVQSVLLLGFAFLFFSSCEANFGSMGHRQPCSMSRKVCHLGNLPVIVPAYSTCSRAFAPALCVGRYSHVLMLDTNHVRCFVALREERF